MDMIEDKKKIPLHSLVIQFGANHVEQKAIAESIFPGYEIISFNDVLIDLVGDVARTDLYREVNAEIKRRAQLKLRLGERVVVLAGTPRQKERQEIARLGERYGAPVFYFLAGKETSDDFERTTKQIQRGDGLAETIDGREQLIEAVPYPININLKNWPALSEFNGITVIPDIHGMYSALRSARRWATSHNHFIVFLGDVIDYGPKPIECIDEVYETVMMGEAVLIYGNHERKIERWMEQDRTGNIRVKLSEGNRVTTDIIEKMGRFEREKFENKYRALMQHARSHINIDRVCFAHAAVHPDMFEMNQHRLRNRELANLAMFGEIDEKQPRRKDGYPNRIYNWCDDIPAGKVAIVGHDIRSTTQPVSVKNDQGGETVFLDNGSGKSGLLTTADLKWKDNEFKIRNYKRH